MMHDWIFDYGDLWQPTINGLRDCGVAGRRSRDGRGGQLRERELRHALWTNSIDDHAGAECLLLLGANRWNGDATLHAHSERVAKLALRLGRRLGLEKDELAALQSAALLHDCGKLALDPAVLCKRGALDGREWSHIRRHPQCGSRLLKRFAFLEEALPGVRSHHERWDGTGYGDGLSGNNIPLAARIISLCDVFDSLTHERPYNSKLSQERALALICDERSTHFDPELCDRFLGLMGRRVH